MASGIEGGGGGPEKPRTLWQEQLKTLDADVAPVVEAVRRCQEHARDVFARIGGNITPTLGERATYREELELLAMEIEQLRHAWELRAQRIAPLQKKAQAQGNVIAIQAIEARAATLDAEVRDPLAVLDEAYARCVQHATDSGTLTHEDLPAVGGSIEGWYFALEGHLKEIFPLLDTLHSRVDAAVIDVHVARDLETIKEIRALANACRTGLREVARSLSTSSRILSSEALISGQPVGRATLEIGVREELRDCYDIFNGCIAGAREKGLPIGPPLNEDDIEG